MNLPLTLTDAPLVNQYIPSLSQSWLKRVAMALAGTALLTLSAKISIPFIPVPLTMQTLVVLLLGFVFGARLAFLTVGLYLLQGALGLPVFAGTPVKGIGLAYMVGPTGGYLVGFLIAAVTCGKLADAGWGKNLLTTFSGMVIGNLIIYLCGLTWLANFVGFGEKLFQLGILPFLLGDLLKIGLAMVILPSLWKLTNYENKIK